MTETKKDRRGGPRPGAGRPRTADGVTFAVYLPRETAAATREQAAEQEVSLSQYVTEAIEARIRKERRRAKKAEN